MHILIVSQYFWPENFRINDITKRLVEQGNKVTVITGKPNYPDGRFYPGYGFFKKYKEKFHGADIIRVPLIPRGDGSGLRLILNYLSFMIFGCFWVPFLKIPEYDIIFVYQLSPITAAIPAIFLKKIKKVPLVMYTLDLWPESLLAVGAVKSEKILKVVGKMVYFIYKNCDKILVPSKGFIDNIKKYNISDSKIIYWPQWGEDIFNVKPEGDLQAEILPNGFKIMFAGNIGAAQGLEIIIDVAEKLKKYSDIYWIIIGDGRMKLLLEEHIRDRDLQENIIMLGRKPLEMMPDYFSLADCLFLSLKNEPVFSLTLPAKIQTYLACGKPVIAAIDGEGARVVNDAKAGFTCSYNNPDCLAAIVIKMYNLDRESRSKIGINGREYFEKNFNSNSLLTQLLSIFSNEVKGG